MSIPLRYRESTFVSFIRDMSAPADAALAAAIMAAESRTNLVIIGPPGTGKTHLAAAICHAVKDRMPYSWCSVVDLIGECRDDMRSNENRGGQWARDLADESGFVILDDLGREKVTDWTGEIIYRLVNRRYENRRPTIVTSNLTPAELEANGYGPVISRLAEDGRLVNLANADDYRARR